MMGKSVLREKSFSFGLMVINICRYLHGKKESTILTRQLFRSGTAVGALIREAEFAQSKADFINKMSVALKEANETDYWLEILKESDEIDISTYKPVSNLSKEIISMLVSSIKTAKGNGFGKG